MRHEARPDAILIAGPTTSGKSALAIDMARRLEATIINVDSMQVYRDLRILTARPSEDDEAAVPHALYGAVDGAIAYSVALWLADATRAIEAARQAGRIALLVGGTGLYFKALTEGLSDVPRVPHAVHDAWRAWAEGRTPQEMHRELTRRDPIAAARLRPTDPQRILRAIEVHAATGESLTTFQGRRGPQPLAGLQVEAYVLAADRSVLRDRVSLRFADMVKMGALDEVEALTARGLDPRLPVMRALGVPQLAAVLGDIIDIEAATTDVTAMTRAYVRRQLTFMRHQLSGFEQISPEQLSDRLTRQFA